MKKEEFSIVACALLAGLAFGGTDGVWTSTTSSLWSDAANWQDEQKPDGGTATLTARPLNDRLVLDEDATLSGWLNQAGASIYLDASSLPNSADRHGVVSASATFRIDNRNATAWAVPLTGLTTLVVTNSSLFSFCWPQTFLGTIDETQHAYSTLAADYRYAAVSDAAEDAGLLRATTLKLDRLSRFRVYGRYPRAAVTVPCRLTPGSPDLVFLTKDQSARAILSAGQHASAPGLADGSYVRAISFGKGENVVITLDHVAEVESVTTQDVTFAAGAWTARQWFDTLSVGGAHGHVNPVPAGDGTAILEVGRLEGTGNITIDPTTECNGTDGRFVVGDVRNHHGTLWPQAQAKLLFADPPAPDAAGPVLWLDASAAESLTVTDGAVTEWRDVRGGADAVVATPWKTETPPLQVENGANGRAVIDFGEVGSHRAFVFNREVRDVKAAFVVLNGRAGGGVLLGVKSGCTRSYPRGFDAVNGIGNTASNYRVRRHNGIVGEVVENNAYTTINGRAVDYTAAGMGDGWDVYAYSRPSVTKRVSALALDVVAEPTGDIFSGGQMLAEVLLYTNTLTTAQCQAIEAYLMKKWCAPERMGLRKLAFSDLEAGPNACPVVGAVGETGTVCVRDDVDRLGRFAVKAGTRLELGGPVEGLNPTLQAGATLALRARRVPDAPVTDGAVLWIDASAPNAAVTNAAGEVSEVRNLAPNALTPTLWPDQVMPLLTQDAAGRATFDFGDRDNGCCLRAFTNFMATTVFMVWNQHQFGCQPLGCLRQGYVDAAHPTTASNAYRPGGYDSNTVIDFFRNGWSGVVTSRSSPTATSGDWYLNGAHVPSVTGVSTATNAPLLHVGVMEGWGGRVSAIGAYCYDGTAAMKLYTGGFALSEMLIYDRHLSDVERRDVEAYLTRKWFPERTLPKGYSANGVYRLGTLTLAGDATLEATGTDMVIMADAVAGSGTLTLGNGTRLAAKSVGQGVTLAGGFEGVVASTGGALAADPVLHVDVSDAATVTKYLNDYISHLTDTAGGQDLSTAYGVENSWLPRYLPKGCGGLDVADFDTRAAWQSANRRYAPPRGLKWPTRLTNIRTVFWMWRDHPTSGGGWLLGDGQGTADHPSDFTRGDLGTNGAASAYFDVEKASSYVLNGSLRCDGVAVSPTSVPKAGWQTLSLVTTGPCAADRIAADRTCVNGNLSIENISHWGGLQLGEMIIYDRVLTDEERAATELFLMKKWAGEGTGNDNTTGMLYGGMTVTPRAPGAEGLVCGLAGSGTILFMGGATTVCSDAGGLDGRVDLTGGASLKLLGADYSTIDFYLKPGTVLDLGGRTVTVRSVHGAGRVVNGTLVGDRIPDGGVIILR